MTDDEKEATLKPNSKTIHSTELTHAEIAALPLTLTAQQFATYVHANQHRKGKPKMPFVTHLVAVTEWLKLWTANDETLIAVGWLHDTVEDTETTLTDLERRFGSVIRDLVAAETENKLGHVDEVGTWRTRKLDQIARLAHEAEQNPRILYVALADKTANIQEMVTDYQQVGGALWTRFNSSREDQHWYYQQFATLIGNSVIGHDQPDIIQPLKTALDILWR